MSGLAVGLRPAWRWPAPAIGGVQRLEDDIGRGGCVEHGRVVSDRRRVDGRASAERANVGRTGRCHEQYRHALPRRIATSAEDLFGSDGSHSPAPLLMRPFAAGLSNEYSGSARHPPPTVG